MTIELKALKAVLMLRKAGNTSTTKEEQIEEALRYLTESDIDNWIRDLQEELAKTPEQMEREQDEWREQESEREWEQAQQEIASFRRERDEWTDLWDDRARSCGAR